MTYPQYNPDTHGWNDEADQQKLEMAKEAYDFFGLTLALNDPQDVERCTFFVHEYTSLPLKYNKRPIKKGDILMDFGGNVFDVLRSGPKKITVRNWGMYRYDNQEEIQSYASKTESTEYVYRTHFLIEDQTVESLLKTTRKVRADFHQSCGQPPWWNMDTVWYHSYLLMLLVKELKLTPKE